MFPSWTKAIPFFFCISIGFFSLVNATSNSTKSRIGKLRSAVFVYNADIYTVDERKPFAEAFAYSKEGVILAVGTEESVLLYLDEHGIYDYDEHDMEGGFILPGFQDIHTHVPEGGINLLDDIYCELSPNQSLDEYVEVLKVCHDESPHSWLIGAGASVFNFLQGPSPRKVLDEAFPDTSVLVLDDLGHAAMVNSRGMDLSDIEEGPDPNGGIYGRDADGKLNGILLESAQQKARDAFRISDAKVYKGLLTSLEMLGRNGITTISDAGGFWTRGVVEAWRRAEREDKVTVRARNALYIYPDMPYKKQIEEIKKRFSNDQDRLVNFNTAKIYVDGILDLGSALMIDKYEYILQKKYPYGFKYFDGGTLQRYTRDLLNMGLQINYHCIGDGATRLALDMLESAGRRASRSRTTHNYFIESSDMARFKQLDVIADFQMAPVALSNWYQNDLKGLIGNRAQDIIPIKETLREGAKITISTDWDADPISPIGSLKRAVLNRGVDMETAVKMWTINAAYALKMEKKTGSLEVGKLADFVVLSENVFRKEVRDLEKVKVDATFVGGHVVYDRYEQ